MNPKSTYFKPAVIAAAALFTLSSVPCTNAYAASSSIESVRTQISERKQEHIQLDEKIKETDERIRNREVYLAEIEKRISKKSINLVDEHKELSDSVYEHCTTDSVLDVSEYVVQSELENIITTAKYIPSSDGTSKPEDLKADADRLKELEEKRNNAASEIRSLKNSKKELKAELKNSKNVLKKEEARLNQMIEDAKPRFGGILLQYSAPYNVTANRLTRRNGEVFYNGHRETYYSQRVLPGGGLSIPGRHVAQDGTIRDKDGYICVASDLSYMPRETTLMTSLGPAKVYDTGCSYGTIDIYVNW